MTPMYNKNYTKKMMILMMRIMVHTAMMNRKETVMMVCTDVVAVTAMVTMMMRKTVHTAMYRRDVNGN